MKFVVYRDVLDEWRWSLQTDSGILIADSAEGYLRKAECLETIEMVKAEAAAASFAEESRLTYRPTHPKEETT